MNTITMSATKDTARHPCFNKESSGECGRVHLPVAPKCNIACGYCNRKYDCVNESRPGVSSAVLSPGQALLYLDEALAREPRITVAGIAGPGDPFANPVETLNTLRLIKAKYPHLLFCISTNGLGVAPHVEELKELGVTHMTVTMNAVDPEIGAKIYGWARDGKVLYRGRDAARLLISRQLEAVSALKAAGMIVKVNSIVIPGVNDHHIEAVAAEAATRGADIFNVLPLHPTAETPLAHIAEPSKETIRAIRAKAGRLIPQMTHCRRCRADAVGLLCKDRSVELATVMRACAKAVPDAASTRPYVAVATREGALVNQHLGEARTFQVWGMEDGVPKLKGTRPAPAPGKGPSRWEELAGTLSDCRAVLVASIGETPRRILEERQIMPHECSGFIADALEAVYGAGDLSAFRGRRRGIGGACCSGGGGKSCV
jgi:nitrogen fixation protein NifB